METKNKYELISFAICPYVQRSVITANHKGIDFEVKYIDLANKPSWFMEISPLGKVPVLRIENEVLFESAVINEFLDEVSEGSLLSSNPIEKAKQRAWIEFSSSILVDQYLMSASQSREEYESKEKDFFSKLKRVEEQIKGEFFSGDKFSLVDSSYAPIFMRALLSEKVESSKTWEEIPKVRKWAEKLLELDEVKNSVRESFKEDYIEFFKAKGSYMLN